MKGKSADRLAKKLHVSRVKIEKARAVNDRGDTETHRALDTGEISLNKAATQVRERRQSPGPAPEPAPLPPAPPPPTLIEPSLSLESPPHQPQKQLTAWEAKQAATMQRNRDQFTIYSTDDLLGVEYLTTFDKIGTRAMTIEDVVEEIRSSFRPVFERDEDGDLFDSGGGYTGRDVAIWTAGRIVAVVRADANGDPIATIF